MGLRGNSGEEIRKLEMSTYIRVHLQESLLPVTTENSECIEQTLVTIGTVVSLRDSSCLPQLQRLSKRDKVVVVMDQESKCWSSYHGLASFQLLGYCMTHECTSSKRGLQTETPTEAERRGVGQFGPVFPTMLPSSLWDANVYLCHYGWELLSAF